MSLGLDDLTKKRRKAEAKKKLESVSDVVAPSPQAVHWSRTHTARPWGNSGLVKTHSRSRKIDTSDTVMNDEWASIHAPPIFWIEITPDSRLDAFQQRLADFETRLQKSLRAGVNFAVTGPASILRELYKKIRR